MEPLWQETVSLPEFERLKAGMTGVRFSREGDLIGGPAADDKRM